MAITAETRQSIIELVVTAYNAAPGTTLLTELVAIIESGGTLADVADNLTASSQWTSTYPSFQTAEEFAAEWLGNLVPEAGADALAEGISVAVGLINGGASFADLLIQASSFLSALSEDDAAFGSSAANFNNKVEVATYHTITQETDGIDSAALASVTSDDASVDTAKASVDSSAAAEEGTTFTLTTSVDTPTGGAGDDTFSAKIGGSDATLNAADRVDGGDGADSITIASAGGAAVSSGGYTLSNIETISVTAALDTSTDDTTLNLASASGYTTLRNSGSSSDVVFSNVGSLVDLELAYTAGTGITTVTYASSADSGANTQNIMLTDAGSAGTVTVEGVEIVEVTATGASTLVLDAEDATDVNVNASGTTTISLSAGMDSLTAVDGSASTGNVTYAMDFSTAEISLTAGTGNDTISISAGIPGTRDVIDGGDGIDAIFLASTGAADVTSIAGALASISNVEVLSLRAVDGANNDTITVDMDNLEGVGSISLSARDQDTVNTFNLNDLSVDQAAAISVGYVTGSTGATINLDIKDGTGTEDSASVTVSPKSGATTTIQDASDTLEHLTVAVGSLNATATLTINASDFDSSLTVTGGTEGRLLDMDGTAITSDIVDLSDVVSNTRLLLGADTITVTGGSGNDRISFGTTYTNADSVDGGDGSDTVRLELTGSLTTAINVTNVETVALASQAASSSVNGSGIDNITIIDTATDTDSAVTDVVSLLNFSGSTIGFSNQITAGANILNAFSLANGFTGSDDSLALTFDGSDSAGSDAQMSVGDITLNGVETLTVSIADIATSLTLGDGTSDGIVGSTLSSVTITGGDAGISYDLGDIRGSAAGSIDTVDMTGLTGNVTVEVDDANDDAQISLGIGTNIVVVTAGGSSTSGVTITGNTGADTITGTALADIITGGAGIDTITGNGGADTITLGAGVDNVVIGAALTDTDSDGVADATSTITDFAGGTSGDQIDIDDDIFTGYDVTATTVTLVNATILDALDAAGGIDYGTVSVNYVLYDTAANILAGTFDVGTDQNVIMGVASDTGAIYALIDSDNAGADADTVTDTITQVGTINSGMGSLVAGNFEIIA